MAVCEPERRRSVLGMLTPPVSMSVADTTPPSPMAKVLEQVRLRAKEPREMADWTPHPVGGALPCYATGCAVFRSVTPSGDAVVVKAWSYSAMAECGLLHQLLNEVHAHALVAHPAIVPLLALLPRAGAAYLVFPDGGDNLVDLQMRLETGSGGASGAAPRVVVQSLLRQLGPALLHMHTAGLVHCDVKFENIVYQELPGGRLRFRLIDLGSATIPGLGRSPAVTASHMPPEAARAWLLRLLPGAGAAECDAAFSATVVPGYDARCLAQVAAELALGARFYRGGPITRSADAAAAVAAAPEAWARAAGWRGLGYGLRDVIQCLGHPDPRMRATIREALSFPFVTSDAGDMEWSLEAGRFWRGPPPPRAGDGAAAAAAAAVAAAAAAAAATAAAAAAAATAAAKEEEEQQMALRLHCEALLSPIPAGCAAPPGSEASTSSASSAGGAGVAFAAPPGSAASTGSSTSSAGGAGCPAAGAVFISLQPGGGTARQQAAGKGAAPAAARRSAFARGAHKVHKRLAALGGCAAAPLAV
ncbi:MAG: kinase-like domain-containing protein [Monoraphidium minutum]|nr:MAG: kinase-like domain-containing protein [Monoraphidium minutum]